MHRCQYYCSHVATVHPVARYGYRVTYGQFLGALRYLHSPLCASCPRCPRSPAITLPGGSVGYPTQLPSTVSSPVHAGSTMVLHAVSHHRCPSIQFSRCKSPIHPRGFYRLLTFSLSVCPGSYGHPYTTASLINIGAVSRLYTTPIGVVFFSRGIISPRKVHVAIHV